MTFKVTAEDTDGRFSLALERTAPQAGIPMHVHHREDEAMYILEGEYQIECGGERILAVAGTFVLLPKDVPNRYQNVGQTPGSFLYITCPGGFERVVEKTSALMARGEGSMEAVGAISREHDVEFVGPGPQ